MSEHSERAHSPWGGSQIERIALCPGSVRESRGRKEAPSIFALEGTQAHELLEKCLRAGSLAVGFGHPAFDGVKVCFDHVQDLLAEFPDAVLLIEIPFVLDSAVAPGEVYGTCDICIYVPSLKRLYLIDYKHGAGIFVDVVGNMQVRFYANGALVTVPEWIVGEVVLTIVQPRIDWADPIRSETVPVSEIVEFGFEIDAIIRRALAPKAPLVPGEKQCKFCPARVGCPERERMAMLSVGEDFGDVVNVSAMSLPAPDSMPNDRLGHILAMAAVAESWFDDLRKEAAARLAANISIPGWKLVEAQAKSKFDGDPLEIAQKLSDLADGIVPPEYFLEHKLKGVTETTNEFKAFARAGLPRKEQKGAVEAITHKLAELMIKRSSGNPTLVADSDPRPPINRALAAFGDAVMIPFIETIDSTEN